MVDHDVQVHSDRTALVDALAQELEGRLTAIQQEGRIPQLCLTGGTVAMDLYARVAERSESGETAVDWSRVEVWWGDERFTPTGHDDRNSVQTARSTGGRVGVDLQRVHEIPASDDGYTLEEAAAAYADEVGETRFDVCLLGLGPDGHVASLFPNHPSSTTPGRVIGVRNSPKPPPERVSATLEVINSSAAVWLVVSGDEKADAVRGVLAGDASLPGSHVQGAAETRLFCDRAAHGG